MAAGVRKPTGIVEMFGGQLHPMDRPGAIGAGLSSESIDLIQMHDAFLCPEGNPMAGHEQHHQCDAKAENEPLHIPLLCRYGASTITPGASPRQDIYRLRCDSPSPGADTG